MPDSCLLRRNVREKSSTVESSRPRIDGAPHTAESNPDALGPRVALVPRYSVAKRVVMGGRPIEGLTEEADGIRATRDPIADGAVAVALNLLLIALWIPLTLRLIFSGRDDAVGTLADQQRDPPTPKTPKPKDRPS